MTAAWDRLRLLTFREARTHARRSGVTIGVIAAAAALLVAITGVYGSLTGSVDRLTASVACDADFDAAGITDTGFDQSLTAGIAAVPGVAAAVPLLLQGTGNGKFLLFGVTRDITRCAVTCGQPMPPLMNFAHCPTGSRPVPGWGGRGGQRVQVGTGTVTVATVVDADLNGGRFIVAPLPLAQHLTQRADRIDSVLVVAKPDTDSAQLRTDVEAAIGGRAVVVNPDFRGEQARQTFALVQLTLLALAGVAFVVAAFLVFNTMSMTVTRRRPQISMVRALGGRRRVVAGDLLLEAGVVGLAGAVGGTPIGVLAGRWVLGRLPPLMTDLVDAHIAYQVPGYAVPLAALACVGAAVTATVVAARQAYRVPPIEALAPVEVSSADRVNLALRGQGPVAASTLPLVFAASVPLCVCGAHRSDRRRCGPGWRNFSARP